VFIVFVSHVPNNISMYLYSYRHHKNAIIAHKIIASACSSPTTRVAGDLSSCLTRIGGGDGGGGKTGFGGDGGTGGGGTHVVSASLAADVASAASAESAAKLSKLDSSIPGIFACYAGDGVAVGVSPQILVRNRAELLYFLWLFLSSHLSIYS